MVISFFLHVNLSFGQLPDARKKNILFLNSYHQGFEWSDSITGGIIQVINSNPHYTLYVENLQSKQFGQTRFGAVNEYISKKYSGIPIDGVLVSDNDALDFAFRYQTTLFPNVPVVFAGIANPEEYPLEGSRFYGFKETAPIDSIVYLIRKVLPDTKRLLVLIDNTTTGAIYRHQILALESKLKGLDIVIPEVVDMEEIYRSVSSGNEYDAIYYIGISQDKYGNLMDINLVGYKIALKAQIPLFSNRTSFFGEGLFGGLYQSGRKQGTEAAKLLVRLMNSTDYSAIAHINTTELNCFFDQKMLNRFGIPKQNIPTGAVILNQESLFTKSNFTILISILALLSLISVFLFVNNRTRKYKQLRSDRQLREIETQKNQLEETSMKLSSVISQLESSNDKLNETNANLLEAKKKAEESDKLKSAFLANVSHEIRTPLNSIVGFSSLLCDGDLNDGTKKAYSELIESNTESLLVLIDEIIDLSKIEAHQLTIKKKDFSIDLLLSELHQIFSQSHTNPNVELRMRRILDTKELIIFSDRVRVKQIFINLLSNANKFTNSGFIEFGYCEDKIHGMVFYVKDTGIGISSEFHQAVFHRFRKLNENSGKVFRGTGLGLAISQKLVELLGGKIWLESEPGHGSTFYFTLNGLTLNDIPV